MTYYAITTQGKETMLLHIKKENGKQVSKVVQVFSSYVSAIKEMNIRNNRLHASVLREYGITSVS